jgi:cycloartenol synthase
MWKFAPASDSDGHPLLRSLNNNIGRQVWVYDPNAGTPEERKAVEEAQANFTANRFNQKDSADELLRCVLMLLYTNVGCAVVELSLLTRFTA